MINFALEQGIDYAEITSQYKRIDDLPFDSENRYMASGFLHSSDEMFYFVKGDPEVITKMCDGYLLADGSYQQMNFDILYTINSQVDHIVGARQQCHCFGVRSSSSPRETGEIYLPVLA